MKTALLFLFLISITVTASSQSVIDKLGKKVERKAQQRADRKTDRAIDKGLDGVENIFKGKKKKDQSSGNDKKQKDQQQNGELATGPGSSQTGGFAASSKFDFVPGSRVIAMEDFMQDAVGDFPAKWNTNASAEIMTISGDEGHWLALTGKGAFTPDFVTSIPENATIEFDLYVTPGYNFYNDPLLVSLIESKDKNDFTSWVQLNYPRTSGVRLEFHPKDASSMPTGRSAYSIYEKGKQSMTNKASGISAFNNKSGYKVHIALWRQKQRLRAYVGESKIWDIPQAFSTDINYNKIVFSTRSSKAGEHFFISNIRVAVGDPDTRHKLLTEGKFSTSGIYFNTGSATIRSESHGVLKEIAQILKENSDLKILIVGHTDNTGTAGANQTLSEQRAASVKKYLNSIFEIDNGRMTTTGKGSSQSVADNNSPEGRAQNRRVEFIKQ